MTGEIENGPVPEALQGASPRRTAKRLVMATRPMFFPASLLPVVLGTAWGAREAGALDAGAAALALAATVLVHAGANVVNDVWDDASGADAANTDRIYPYTGGSRFIQSGILSRAAMQRLGLVLLLTGAVLGIALAALKGPVVIALGLAGVGLGVAYSAAPFRLSAKGLGELAVGIGFGVLPVMGAAWLQRGAFGMDALLVSLPLAFWVFNILLINGIPDTLADRAAGKRTLAVRAGARGAAFGFAATNFLALVAVGAAIARDLFPVPAIALPVLLAAAALALSIKLYGGATDRVFLARAIKTTLAIHVSGGLWLIVFAIA